MSGSSSTEEETSEESSSGSSDDVDDDGDDDRKNPGDSLVNFKVMMLFLCMSGYCCVIVEIVQSVNDRFLIC